MNIDRREYERLRQFARENDVSIAWVARRALKTFLAQRQRLRVAEPTERPIAGREPVP